MRQTKREELTIQQYLSGCHCKSIFFSSGGCLLALTKEQEGSALIFPSGYNKVNIRNHYNIIRHYDTETDELIEVQIRQPVDEYNFNPICYMMYPTGTFVSDDGA